MLTRESKPIAQTIERPKNNQIDFRAADTVTSNPEDDDFIRTLAEMLGLDRRAYDCISSSGDHIGTIRFADASTKVCLEDRKVGNPENRECEPHAKYNQDEITKAIRQIELRSIRPGSVRVFGFSSGSGNNQHNHLLSQKRAAVVENLLRERAKPYVTNAEVDFSSSGMGEAWRHRTLRISTEAAPDPWNMREAQIFWCP